MAVPKDILWGIESHTIAKHEILCRYLGAWFAILGSKFPGINYIDGFAGPGRYKGGEEGSPILALKIAAGHKAVSKFREVRFLFVEKEKARADHLIKEVDNISIPANFQTEIKNDEFEIALCEILDDLEKKEMILAPTFAFVDPFGFKGLSYSLIERILANQSSEVFINFMANSINRWTTTSDKKTQQRIIELFGTEEVVEKANNLSNRMKSLRALYQAQLKKIAKFVRYFEMYDSNNRLVYVLFFAGNNRIGHLKMKEVFWKVDPSSGLRFSDATDPNQATLFDLDPSVDFAEFLFYKFSGRQVVRDIRIEVEDNTPYLTKHMRAALKLLENSGRITVDPIKENDENRHGKSFPNEVIVHFGQK